MNKKMLLIATLSFIIPAQLCAQKRNTPNKDNVKTATKILAYTCATLLTYVLLEPGSDFIRAPKGIASVACTGIILHGIGDVFEIYKARKYGRRCIFASGSAWLANAFWVNRVLNRVLPGYLVTDNTIRRCFFTLIFLAGLEKGFSVATKAKEGYKRFRYGDDYDDED